MGVHNRRNTHRVRKGRILTFGGYESWVFLSGLGELRGVVGIHLAALAAQYGLDIPDPLSVILPADASDSPSKGRGLRKR